MYTDYTEDNEENYYDDDNNNKFDKEKIKKIVFYTLVVIILIILGLIILKSCNKESNVSKKDNNTEQVGLNILYTNYALNISDVIKLESDFLINNSKVNNADIYWYSEDSDVATVNENGIVEGISEGETNIVAQVKYKGITYEAKCLITVTSKEVKAESISLGQSEMKMQLDAGMLLQVTITPSDAKIDNLIFESEDPSIVSVDDTGYIEAKKIGKTNIIVKTADESLKTSILVEVISNNSGGGTVQIEPTSVILFGLDEGLTVGKTSEMLYKVLPENTTNKKLTWKSSDPTIAAVEDGLVTGLKPGKCSIIATTSNGISGEVEITVESSDVPVSSIQINGSTNITMSLGANKYLSYTVLPENATNKNVQFTTSNSSVVRVNSNGMIAAGGIGTATITIKSVDNDVSTQLYITVVSNNMSYANIVDNSNNNQTSSIQTVRTDDNNTNTCSSSSLIIASNQKDSGASTSVLSFEQAVAFTKQSPIPGLKVTTYDDCINKATYKMWYNENNSKINIASSPTSSGNFPKLGDTLYLRNGDGYYLTQVTITLNDGSIVSKNYYSIVSSGSTSSSILVTKSSNSENNFSVTTQNSQVKKIAFCVTTKTSCDPAFSYTNSSSYYYGVKSITTNLEFQTVYNETKAQLSSGKYNGNYICFRGGDNNKAFIGEKICRKISNTESSIDSNSKINVTYKQKGTNTNGSKWCKYEITKTGTISSFRLATSYVSADNCKNKLTSSSSYTAYSNFPTTIMGNYIKESDIYSKNNVWICFQAYNNGNKVGDVVVKTISSNGTC